MVRFILKRIGYGIIVLIGVVSVVFSLFNFLPVDPARLTLGQRADVESVEAIRHELGLDKPKWQQYFMYLNDVSYRVFTLIYVTSIITSLARCYWRYYANLTEWSNTGSQVFSHTSSISKVI